MKDIDIKDKSYRKTKIVINQQRKEMYDIEKINIQVFLKKKKKDFNERYKHVLGFLFFFFFFFVEGVQDNYWTNKESRERDEYIERKKYCLA